MLELSMNKQVVVCRQLFTYSSPSLPLLFRSFFCSPLTFICFMFQDALGKPHWDSHALCACPAHPFLKWDKVITPVPVHLFLKWLFCISHSFIFPGDVFLFYQLGWHSSLLVNKPNPKKLKTPTTCNCCLIKERIETESSVLFSLFQKHLLHKHIFYFQLGSWWEVNMDVRKMKKEEWARLTESSTHWQSVCLIVSTSNNLERIWISPFFHILPFCLPLSCPFSLFVFPFFFLSLFFFVFSSQCDSMKRREGRKKGTREN